ncbi:MAG: BrnT family toxin [Tepidisphaeraceae bacterium]
MDTDFGKLIGFQWDVGNAKKSLTKHRVTTQEAEEVFADRTIQILDDPVHSSAESRWKAFGRTASGRFLTVSFTVRGNLVHVISARAMNRKERRGYEQKTIQ